LILIWHRMNHTVKRCRQALHQTHHHYYLNISVEAANLSDWRIESKKSIRWRESNRIESKLSCPNWNALVCTAGSMKRYGVRPSVCPSIPFVGAAGLLLWARRVETSTDCCHRGECRQCHVVSARKSMDAVDLFQ